MKQLELEIYIHTDDTYVCMNESVFVWFWRMVQHSAGIGKTRRAFEVES